MKLVKKVSAKTVVGANIKKLLDKSGENTPLYTVIGIATGIKTGISTYGDWACLTGQFRATNMITGELFQGSHMFLPDVAHDMAAVALSSDGVESIEIAFEIGAALTDAEDGAGYEYSVRPLIETQEADPLAAIEDRVAGLKAPKKAAPKKVSRRRSPNTN